MRLPDKDFSVKVGPFVWEVVYSDGVAEESNSFGTINVERQRIYLKENGTQQKREHTFVHEMLHAISYVTGLWKDLDGDPRPTEEQVITRQSMVLYQVIQDNPHIFGDGDGVQQ